MATRQLAVQSHLGYIDVTNHESATFRSAAKAEAKKTT